MKRKGMQKRKSVLGIITALTLLILLLWISRTNSFFVQFKHEDEVETFLLRNLQHNVSSINEVQQVMERYLKRLERCSFRYLSDQPTLSIRDSLRRNYDNTYLRCEVLSHNKFMFDPVTRWYIVDFYFTDEKLVGMNIFDFFVGP
jgi:hypothetical protein